MDKLYDLTPEAYMKLDLTVLPPQDLKELAYYLWCYYEDDDALMVWRNNILLPLVNKICPASPYSEEEDTLDGE